MTDFIKLLSLILEKKPTSLIVNPSRETIVASFDIAKKIQLYDYQKFSNFKEEVINELESFPLTFGSFSFDIKNKKKSEEWKNYPFIEFIFPSYAIKYENNKFNSFGENKELDLYFKNNIQEEYKSNKNESKDISNKKSDDWINLVNKAKKNISDSNLEKIVVADIKKSKLKNLNINKTILEIILKYPNCITYMLNDKNNIFFGTTPEKIFEYENKILRTEALAGSIPNKGEKFLEIQKKFQNSTLKEEHDIVVKYIESQLSKITKNKISISSSEIKKLNNIYHLQSEIKTKIDKNDFFEFINLLHPSPALAGYPIDEALKWIRKNEKFDRGLYAGSIGYIEKNNSSFYAALRCAKYSISEKEIISFAGNGIIKDSKIKYELEELNSKFKAINESLIEN
jgi:menaquinone-specific isochorismate synthase